MTTAVIQRTPGGAPRDQRSHYYQLDSLRGLAAVAVAIHHWHILWSLGPHSRYAALLIQLLPFRLLVAGHSSVMMFFVLSGFVLSLPQVGGKKIDYLPYLVKRVCRIYLPYLVALGVAVLACWKWHGRRAYGAWVNSNWPEAPQWHSILQHVIFIGVYPSIYNSSFWTLVQEMRISLVFPFLCALALRVGRKSSAVLVLALFLLGASTGKVKFLPISLSATISFAGMFVIGICLARWLPQMRVLVVRLSSLQYGAVFLLSVVVYAYAPSVFYAKNWDDTAWDGFTAIGAAGIILFSLVHKKTEAVLDHSFLKFIGRISYSLYLIHMPVLLGFGYAFYGRHLPIFWLGPYLITTITLATAMYYAVEVPSMKLGRTLAGRISSASHVQ